MDYRLPVSIRARPRGRATFVRAALWPVTGFQSARVLADARPRFCPLMISGSGFNPRASSRTRDARGRGGVRVLQWVSIRARPRGRATSATILSLAGDKVSIRARPRGRATVWRRRRGQSRIVSIRARPRGRATRPRVLLCRRVCFNPRASSRTRDTTARGAVDAATGFNPRASSRTRDLRVRAVARSGVVSIRARPRGRATNLAEVLGLGAGFNPRASSRTRDFLSNFSPVDDIMFQSARVLADARRRMNLPQNIRSGVSIRARPRGRATSLQRANRHRPRVFQSARVLADARLERILKPGTKRLFQSARVLADARQIINDKVDVCRGFNPRASSRTRDWEL